MNKRTGCFIIVAFNRFFLLIHIGVLNSLWDVINILHFTSLWMYKMWDVCHLCVETAANLLESNGGCKGALKVTCVTCEVDVGARRPGLNVPPTASSTGIFTTSSPGSTVTVPKNRKHPVSSSCVEGDVLMSGVDGQIGWRP